MSKFENLMDTPEARLIGNLYENREKNEKQDYKALLNSIKKDFVDEGELDEVDQAKIYQIEQTIKKLKGSLPVKTEEVIQPKGISFSSALEKFKEIICIKEN